MPVGGSFPDGVEELSPFQVTFFLHCLSATVVRNIFSVRSFQNLPVGLCISIYCSGELSWLGPVLRFKTQNQSPIGLNAPNFSHKMAQVVGHGYHSICSEYVSNSLRFSHLPW